jgi:hypothetical protein
MGSEGKSWLSCEIQHFVSSALYMAMLRSWLDLLITFTSQVPPKDDDARPESKSATKRRFAVMVAL